MASECSRIEEVDSLDPIKQKLLENGYSVAKAARTIGLPIQDLSHFIYGERDKVGRKKWKKIKSWMTERGYHDPPKPPQRCKCPVCGKVHFKRVPRRFRKSNKATIGNGVRPCADSEGKSLSQSNTDQFTTTNKKETL